MVDAQNAAAAAESEMKRIGDTGSSLEAAAASAIDAATVLAQFEAAGIPDITELTAAVEEALTAADQAQQCTTGPSAAGRANPGRAVKAEQDHRHLE